MHRRAFLLLLLPGVAGCAGMTLRPHALDEAVTVEDLSLAFKPTGAGSLAVRLTILNPTLWDARITGVNFTLELDGQRYAVGTRGVDAPLASHARHALAVSFPLRCEPTADEGRARPWRVGLGGTVALAFGARGRPRLLPFHGERDLRLARFRPLRLAPD